MVDSNHDCVRHGRRSRSTDLSSAPVSLTSQSMSVLRNGSGGGGSKLSVGDSPQQRVLIGVGVAAAATAAAVGVKYVRRLLVGATRSTPPKAEKRPHDVKFGEAGTPGKTVSDDYFWLRDDERKRKEVIDHLKEENAFTNHQTLGLRKNADLLYTEMLSHTQETDMAVPVPKGGYEYYVRTVQGSSYTFHCRRPVQADGSKGDEEIILDENLLAKGTKHCDVAAVEVSPDHTLMAVAVDFKGDEKYCIDFYQLDTAGSKIVEGERIAETNGYVEWGKDNSAVFYGTMDEAHRSDKVWYHAFGAGVDVKDKLLWTETDDMFSAYFGKTLSERFLFIVSSASTTSEYRFIDLDSPRLELQLVAERKDNILYSVDHAGGDRFLITTNQDGATNFKVLEGAVGSAPSTWTEFLAYKEERTILGLSCFEKFTVAYGREGGFSRVWVLEDTDPSKMYALEVDEETSVVALGGNAEFKADKFRYLYSSMTTPSQTYDYHVESRKRTLLKETPVPNYDRSIYKTERLEATADDGTKIPMSLVWNANAIQEEEPNLLHLYGYASYGISIDPSFSANILPMLDRGFVYAIAHCRGGGECGRSWYEAARFETKPLSFSDFIACASLLVDSGRTTPEKMSMEGRSAGGLLMGAVMNLRPDLFRAVISGVPFVDVLNTMSDATIPLTSTEWQEWGNPNDCGKYFDAISGYCPYTNVSQKPYPAALVVAGLYDPRVLYSEPAKWVAKLRDNTTSDSQILLKVDLESGHFSASDRYKHKKERAFELSWLMNEMGASPTKIAG